MDVSTYVLLSHEQALRRRLDVTANNMANTSTIGFKREQPVFREMVERMDVPAKEGRAVSFVLDRGAVHDARAGAFEATGNPLDVAITGPGYLAVTTADGATAYTRAGNLKVLQDGRLATAAGIPVQGEDGGPITIPPEQMAVVNIALDGSVMGTEGPLGRLAVTVFADENAVDPRGDDLFNGTGGRVLPAGETQLRTGGLEASNVQPIRETTEMVDILRAYQTSQRMVSDIADMRKRAIERLGRAGN